MRKLSVVILIALFYSNCTKQSLLQSDQRFEDHPSKSSGASATYTNAAHVNNEEFQILIRKWTEWAYGRDASTAPFNDPDGSFQYLAQPFSTGVFMLAGGSSPDTVSRTVTISLSRYQYVFVPLVVITVILNECNPNDGLHGGQNPQAFFQSLVKESFNGPRDLTLLWDGNSLLSTKQKDARNNSGVWLFNVDPSNSCPEATISTLYSDGYWAKIPLTIGTHTLVVGGNLDNRRYKFAFSNIVTYTIHVVA